MEIYFNSNNNIIIQRRKKSFLFLETCLTQEKNYKNSVNVFNDWKDLKKRESFFIWFVLKVIAILNNKAFAH